MKYKLEVSPYLIKKPTTFYVNIADQQEQYPLACIGRDSYIWNGTVNTGLEFTINKGYTTHNIQIGQFNSIAEGLEFCMGINHSHSRLCMGVSKLFEANEGYTPEIPKYNQKGQIIIQNDVWIGHDVTIMPGVTIGNGAVVAANSHVVSDVAPYTIVGGNPAKFIKYRFDKDLIDKLLTIKWWNWCNEEIRCNIRYFNEDIKTFCDTFYEKYKKERDNVKEYEIYKAEHNFLFFIDFTEKYPIFERVIQQFLESYQNCSDYQLILFIDKNFAENNIELLNTFYEYLEYYSEKVQAECILNICIEDLDKSEQLFKAVNYYITNRAKETVLYSEYADDYNVKIVSGVDTYIFRN